MEIPSRRREPEPGRRDCRKVDSFLMDFLKKHVLLVLWIAGLLVCAVLEVPVWGMVLGSAAYLVLVLFLRRNRSAFWIGYLLQGVLHRPEAAFRLYGFAYRRGGKAGAPMMAYAMLLMEKSQYEQSLAVLKDVQEMDGLSPALRKISRQDLALAYEKTGDVQSAIEIMEQMRQDYEYLRPDFYTTLAYYYIEAGAYDMAEQINALAQTEDGKAGGAAYDNEALIAYRKGDLEQAAALFRKALEADGGMISPQYYLGLIAEETGDTGTAAQCFRAVHDAGVSGLNTISGTEAEEKYLQYFGPRAENQK